MLYLCSVVVLLFIINHIVLIFLFWFLYFFVLYVYFFLFFFFFFFFFFKQKTAYEIKLVTGVQTCALPIYMDFSYRTQIMKQSTTFRLIGTRLLEQSTTVPNATGSSYTDRAGDANLGYADWIITASTNVEIGRASCRERG